MVSSNSFHFHNLSQFPNLFHVVSTKKDGSMKGKEGLGMPMIVSFMAAHALPSNKFILAQQVHGGKSALVSASPNDRVIKDVDALLTSGSETFLGVVTADCLPILLYDSKKNIVGTIHAGFKGLLAQVIPNTLEELRMLGSDLHDVWVGIGPAIGVCCYEVSEDRIALFKSAFPSYTGWYRKVGEKYFLDLQRIAVLSLEEAGIHAEHIETANICTFDHNDTFFSYRAEGPEEFGEFISIIGLK